MKIRVVDNVDLYTMLDDMKEERDKYKAALEEIVRQGRGSLDYYLVAKEALEG